jgi:chemotaxis protein histidine kinase CheA
MSEILDLIAKVTWETNTQELQTLNKELKTQDKMLEELRQRGQRLEQQLAKTNDPAKQAKYSAELAKTKVQMQSITEVQKKQAEVTKTMADRQKELLGLISKTTDPKQYKTMLNELAGIEKAMKGLNNQAKELPGKLSGIGSALGGAGKSILAGLGLGVGSMGLEAITGAVASFVTSANEEFIAAENTALRLQNTLKGLGAETYFDGLISEADALAKQIGYIDNDDIVSAQEKLLTFGKVGRDEISKLMPIIIDLSARMGTDVPTATETMINILEGRGGQALRQLGLSVKDAGTTTERLGVVFEELGPKIAGSAEVVKNSSEGIQRTLDQQIANLQESLGASTIEITNFFKTGYLGFLQFLDDVSKSEADKREETIQGTVNQLMTYNETAITQEKNLNKIREAEIQASQKRINEMKRTLTESGYFELTRIEKEAIYESIQAEQELIQKNQDKNKAVEIAYGKWKASQREKEANDAKIKAERDAQDAEEKNKENQKKQEEANKQAAAKRKAEAEAERKAMEQLAKQVEADRVKLSEFTLNAEEKDLMNIMRYYDEQQALAKNNAELLLQIRENYNNAVIQVERKRVAEIEALNAKEVVNFKSTMNEEAKAIGERGMASLKAMQDDILRQAEKKKADEEQKKANQEALLQSVNDAANASQQLIAIEQERVDRLIGLQEERIAKAKEDSSASLLIEQNRYDELLAQRRKYEQQQRAIDAVVIVANQAVAISSAIRSIITEGAKLGPAGIAAQVIAIGAGLAASLAAVRSATADIPAFQEGGYTGDGNPSETSTAIGKRPYIYHKKEFVMNEELTSKHRDLFEGMHKKDLVVKKLDDGQWYITKSGIDTDKMVDNHYTIKNSTANEAMLYELGSIKQLLERREVNITNNFDSQGFATSIATQLGRIDLKKKLG